MLFYLSAIQYLSILSVCTCISIVSLNDGVFPWVYAEGIWLSLCAENVGLVCTVVNILHCVYDDPGFNSNKTPDMACDSLNARLQLCWHIFFLRAWRHQCFFFSGIVQWDCCVEEAIPAISLMLVLSCSSAMVYNGQMASFVCSTSGMSMNKY